MSQRVDVDALTALLAAATSGPWTWAGNIDSGEPYLASRAPGMGASVLAIGWEPRSTNGKAAEEVRSYARESGMDEDIAVDMWAHDQYGSPIKESRLWFYTDHLAVEARNLVTFEVAPQATSREDPAVYRADITGIRHPDAQLIVEVVNAAPRLLDEIRDLRSRLACVNEATSWDRPYDERMAAIRGLCDLATDGLTPSPAEVSR